MRSPPANFGRGLWDQILSSGAEFGIEAYGTEALHVLRAEKGYIVVGDETDGTVTPFDVGLDGLVSKKKARFHRQALARAVLPQECGAQATGRLLTDDPKEVLPDGRLCGARAQGAGPMETIGQVASSY